MVSPFDWRTVVLAKHAQHVVLIHFPIALFITGVLFDVLARGKRPSAWESAAYLNLSGAAIMVAPAALTGILAWKFALDAPRIKGLLLWHILAASTAAVLVIVSWWIHWRDRRADSVLAPRYRIGIETIGVILVGLTAHLGGFLSGINS